MNDVRLVPLEESDREQFVKDNQEAFNYGALEVFGRRDDHFEEDGQIISRATIEASIDGENAETYRIMLDGEKVGGAVLKIEGEEGKLELFFVSPRFHSQGIGYAAWREIETSHPGVKRWETTTPYFEKRNVHFYVNRCGFHIVEYFTAAIAIPTIPRFRKTTQTTTECSDLRKSCPERRLETERGLYPKL